MSSANIPRPPYPWELPATVVIPHLDTPDWLMLSVEMWRRQSVKPYVLVIDTASRKPLSEVVCRHLASLPLVEVAQMHAKRLQHGSDAICWAMDYAFSRCATEYLIATHTDCVLKHRDVVKTMIDLCNAEHPVVGWEMSRRGPGENGDFDGTTSDGFPGHVCTVFHMPTMDQIGAGWSMRRSTNAFGTSRTSDPVIKGWPDTETCIGLIFQRANLKPLYLGRETNHENQETEHWIHVRSRTSLGLTPRHADGYQRAIQIVNQWRKEDGETTELPYVLDEGGPRSQQALAATCPFRAERDSGGICYLAAAVTGVDAEAHCRVELNTCLKCKERPAPSVENWNGIVCNVINRVATEVVTTGGLPGCSVGKAKAIQKKVWERRFDLDIEMEPRQLNNYKPNTGEDACFQPLV